VARDRVDRLDLTAEPLRRARVHQDSRPCHRRRTLGVEQRHTAGHRIEVARDGIRIDALLHRELRRRPCRIASIEQGDVAAAEVPQQPPRSRR
jgi:hypothetical protein